MDKIGDYMKFGAAGITGILTYLFGTWDSLIIALVAFVVIDYITGVANAAMKGKLSSSIGFNGLLKKLMIFLLVAIGTVLDRVIPAANDAIRSAVIMFYIANEGLSILENACEMGIPFPKIIKMMLGKLADDAGEELPEHKTDDEK